MQQPWGQTWNGGPGATGPPAGDGPADSCLRIIWRMDDPPSADLVMKQQTVWTNNDWVAHAQQKRSASHCQSNVTSSIPSKSLSLSLSFPLFVTVAGETAWSRSGCAASTSQSISSPAFFHFITPTLRIDTSAFVIEIVTFVRDGSIT